MTPVTTIAIIAAIALAICLGIILSYTVSLRRRDERIDALKDEVKGLTLSRDEAVAKARRMEVGRHDWRFEAGRLKILADQLFADIRRLEAENAVLQAERDFDRAILATAMVRGPGGRMQRYQAEAA